MLENGKTRVRYWSSHCQKLSFNGVMHHRLNHNPEKLSARRETVEHPFGMIKAWTVTPYFLTTQLDSVQTKISLHVQTYNLMRLMNILGVENLIEAVRARLSLIIR